MSVRTLVQRPAALLLQAAVLTALVGGTAAWSLSEKTVSLSVDGRAQTVSTHGSTVRDVLAAAHLSAGPHDLLAPSANSAVRDGAHVALRRGRQLRLSVDGTERTVWVTAASVAEALGQIGLRADGAVLSASRSRSIPLSGMDLSVLLPKAVAILADGHVTAVTSVGPTVRDALIQAGIRLHPKDRLSAPRSALLRDHMVIRVTRVDGRRVVESLAIPFATVQRPDANLFRGQTEILVQGRPGVLVRTYTLNYVDGHLKSKLMGSEKRTADPITQVVGIGTKQRPAAVTSSNTGTSADGLNWPALANCESGGNPRAVSSNGQYRGLYQFSFSTWQGVGGSGDPIDASSGEQTYRAKLLYQRSGRSPWPVCGRYL